MTTIRRIPTSKIDGNDANVDDANEIRPFGETAFYLDTNQTLEALTLMMFDGVRTHVRSKVLSPGVLYGSNENSSDGLGYDTIKLVPDSFLDWNSGYTNDQYIIIEPTSGEPGHVHIRSGGAMDQSTVDLFLGGELNHVKVSDTNDAVIISTDAGGEGATNEWAFNSAGYLQFPGGSNGRIGEDEPGLVVYSDLSFGILTNLANTENSRAWIFTNEGDLTLPQGGTISETTIGMNPTVVIIPAEADSPNQALYIKGGLPPEPGDYHLHLTTGDLTDTSIIVGTDDHNIRTTVDGGIELNSYNYNTSTQQTLAFGTDGAITTNDALVINVLGGIGAGANTHWTFGDNGNLTLPEGGDVVNSTGVSQTAQRMEGSWTLPDDTTDTYSFTLPSDGTYIMWVKGNIPNGIITWNATASVTNTNVPAIGSQYAWNYTGGGSPILLTALPDQIRGVAGTISTDATYAGTTSNRFDFEISNTSGSNQTVYWGYTKI